MIKLASLDPRLKLLILITLTSAAVFLRNPLKMGLLTSYTMLLLAVGGVEPKSAWLRIRLMIKLILLLFLMQCFFNRSGEALLVLWGRPVLRAGGLLTATLVSLRLIIIALSTLIIMTGTPRDYLLAFTQCKVPYEISYMALAAMRFIPLLREEGQNTLAAMQMRGTKLCKTSPIHKAKVYLSVMLPTVASAIRHSEQMAIAMEARGFRALPYRTNMRKLCFKRRDLLYLICFTIIFVAVIYI